MKEEINELVLLAKEYAELGRKYKFSNGFTKLGEDIRVYFANQRGTCSVDFGDIEIKFYKESIEMPIV